MSVSFDIILAGLGIVSIASCIFLSAVYWVRPPGWDPITLWPFAAWAILGLVLAGISIFGRAPAIGWIAAILWILAAIAIGEEARFVARGVFDRRPRKQRAMESDIIRVITLNCANVAAAAAEPLTWEPDLILLQEAPPRDKLMNLLDDYSGWSLLSGGDPAIIARGRMELTETDGPKRRLIMAKAHLRGSQMDIAVISTHLSLPILPWAFWSPVVWRGAADARKLRVRQMGDVMAAVEGLPDGLPIIAGGDFNTPAGDSLLRPLAGNLYDAFGRGGAGWPNTFPNSVPCSRIDRIWVSKEFDVVGGRVVATTGSDHRMVIVDLRLADTAMVAGH